MSSEFTARVLSVVRRLPPGRVASYGDVAALAGRPGAARAVGSIMRRCTARDVPCHRVVAAQGHVGGFGGAVAMKCALLAAEGILIHGRRIRNFEACRWQPRRTGRRPAT